ncbi:nuclease [Lysobacter koreensis]|uniref:Nuclease n=1 Tax=Lysobacter koreensis TaxID=266122 RepID=A0ABW2YLN2_9GAMM
MQTMLRRLALMLLLPAATASIGLGAAHAQVSLTSPGSPVLQDFDALPASGSAAWTNNTTLAGWYHARTGTGTTVVANNGSSNAGNLYSYGSGAATERALGSLGSSNAAVGHLFWGVRLQNNTGAPITTLDVSYTGEQWRNSAAAAQTIAFSYLVGAPAVTGTLAEFQAAGTAVPALDFTSLITGGTASALDGNLPANRAARSTTITGLNIPVGGEILLRWSDPDQTGADHGLAIDDVSITVPGAPTSNADLAITISDSPDPVAQGGAITYAIVASNAGPDAATGATLTIPVPTGTAWQSIAATGAWDCTSAGNPPVNGPGAFTCTLPSFASGASDTFTLQVQVLPTSMGPITSTPAISSSAGDPVPANNSATATTTVDVPITAIHTLQGAGAASPLVNQTVRTRGVVTGRKGNGFFLQTPDAEIDADPATSEGVFVFTSSAPPAAAAVGSLVTVDGRVLEFVPSQDPLQAPLTEIGFVTSVVSLSTGNALPAPIALTATYPDPAGALDQLEPLEGMRVTAPSFTVVAPTAGNTNEANASGSSNGLLHAVVTGVARPFREPGIQAPDPAPAGSSIPPIPRWDFNPELLVVDSDSLGGAAFLLDLTTGSVIQGLTGPLDYGFRRYTVHRDPLVAITVTPGATPRAARAPAADEFSVAAYNLERFFDTTNDPGKDDAVLTPAAFEKRLGKASLGIRDFLRTPDILGVVEMEKLPVLQTLADRLNADAVAAGQPDPGYVAYLEEGNDIGGIDVGFLVKTASVAAGIARVQVVAVTQVGKDTTWIEPDGSSALLNDRPPLLLDAVVHYADGRAFPVTVIVVHNRSLNGAEDDSAGGDRVRRKRQRQAEFLATLVAEREASAPGTRIVMLGDFNAFAFNDGYVDAMNVIAGTPTADAQTVVPGDGIDLLDPDLINLGELAPASERYSFVFGGNAQTLDHVLVNEELVVMTRSLESDHARINADFPETNRNDANSPSRLADHDPVVAYFAPRNRADLGVTATATAATVRVGGTIGFNASVTNHGPDAAEFPGIGFALDGAQPTMAVTAPAGWTCDAPQIAAGKTSVACNASTLGNGVTAGFTVSAAATAALIGTTVNLAVAGDAQSYDPVAGNNQAGASVGVYALADLGVVLYGRTTTLRSGMLARYRVAVEHAGGDAAPQARLVLSGDAPAGNVAIAAAAGWSCAVAAVGAGFEATCSRDPLAAGAKPWFDLNVVAPPPESDQRLTVVATVSSLAQDPTPGNNTSVNVLRLIR